MEKPEMANQPNTKTLGKYILQMGPAQSSLSCAT